MRRRLVHLSLAIATAAMLSTLQPAPARAAQCQPPGGFNAFIAQFKAEAARLGVSQRAISALDGITEDKRVLSLDRNQKGFRVSFEEFSPQAHHVGPYQQGQGAAE